jgi:hypothetical protein
MTTTETVMRIIPLCDRQQLKVARDFIVHLSAAAAPRNAYVPGVIHGTSGWQTAKMPEVGYALHTTALSTSQPNDANCSNCAPV